MQMPSLAVDTPVALQAASRAQSWLPPTTHFPSFGVQSPVPLQSWDCAQSAAVFAAQMQGSGRQTPVQSPFFLQGQSRLHWSVSSRSLSCTVWQADSAKKPTATVTAKRKRAMKPLLFREPEYR